MKTRWTVLTALVLATTVAQAQSPQQPLEQWQTYANAPQANVKDLGQYQAMAVFYRLSDVSGAPVNVYVNGRYQASLLPNSFSARAVCADKQAFGAAFSSTEGFNKINDVHETLPLRDMAFFRVVTNRAGQPELKRVSFETAKAELGQARPVAQTLSRTPEAHQLQCAAPVLQTNQISVSALFGFNQYRYEGIEPSGYQALNDILDKIKALGQDKIQKIVITGHTDPDGSDEYNLQLSQKRAKMIQAALREKGGVSVPMEAVGVGKQELRVKDCATLHPNNTAARLSCNQPNRRVEITVYGHNKTN